MIQPPNVYQAKYAMVIKMDVFYSLMELRSSRRPSGIQKHSKVPYNLKLVLQKCKKRKKDSFTFP